MTTEDIVFSQTEAAFRALTAAWTNGASASLAIFVDPTLADPIGDGLPADGTFPRYPLTALKERFPDNRVPYLIHVPDAERSWLFVNGSVEQAVRESLEVADDNQRPRSVCGWIVDPGDCRALAHRLGKAAMVIRPEREFWPLRYWDPRVIGHLPRVLAPEQYSALRPCLGNWWSLNGLGRLAPASAATSTEAAKLPLRFDDAQWRGLQRIEHVNALVRMAATWGLAQGPEVARRIDESMQRAERHGFAADEDLRAFAVCALIGHPRFDEHPRVAESIKAALEAGRSFAAAIDEYDDEFWTGLNDGRWLEQLQKGVMTWELTHPPRSR